MWWKQPWTERRLPNNCTVDVLSISKTCRSSAWWKLFEHFFRKLQLFKKDENTIMWEKGFNILQNIKNRCVIQHDSPKWPEYITKHTINKLNTYTENRKKRASSKEEEILLTLKGTHFWSLKKLMLLFWAVANIMMNNMAQSLKIFETKQLFMLNLLQSLTSCIFIRFNENFFKDQSVDSGFNIISSLSLGKDDIINRCKFGNDGFIPPSSRSTLVSLKMICRRNIIVILPRPLQPTLLLILFYFSN